MIKIKKIYIIQTIAMFVFAFIVVGLQILTFEQIGFSYIIFGSVLVMYSLYKIIRKEIVLVE